MTTPLWRFLTAAVVVTAPMAAHGDDVPARTRIDAVKVFPSRADITRLGEVAIPEGEHRVIVAGLPANVDTNSLRVRFDNEAIIVGAVEARPDLPQDGGPPEAQRLRNQLERLQEQVQQRDYRVQQAELQLSFLKSRADATEGEAGSDPSNWPEALSALQTGANEAHQTIITAQRQRRDLERQIEEVQLQLRDFDDDFTRRTTVQVALTATSPIKARMALDYQVSGTGWSAVYDARLDSTAGAMVLERKVKVTQNTGEDWRNVRLSLSTAPPTNQVAAPNVNSQFLRLMEEQPSPPPPAPAPMASRELGGLATENAMAADMMVVTGSRRQTIETVNANFAQSYAVGGRVDVLSDNRARTFSVGQEDLEVELVVRAAPRIRTDAYLIAQFTYAGDGPLPAGALRKYRDGAFLREDRLDSVIPGEEIELGFGQDQAVIIAWADEAGDENDVGLMGRTREIVENHRFDVTNRHAQAYTVELVDFRPVSRDDDITVRVSADTTTPDEENWNDKPGVLVWRRDVAADETWSVRNGFTIRYPANETLLR